MKQPFMISSSRTDEPRRADRLSRLNSASEHLGQGTNLRALDLGTEQAVSGELLKRGFQVDAVDISGRNDRCLRKTAKRHNRKIKNDHSGCRSLNKRRAPDMITASSILHHFPDYGATMKQMVTHLKPGLTRLFS